MTGFLPFGRLRLFFFHEPAFRQLRASARMELGQAAEKLHDDADLHVSFTARGLRVNLPTVFAFVSGKRAVELALVVRLVRHHKQRRNELWAFQ